RGRPFTPEEEVDAGAPVAILGDALWRSRFAADSGILGQTAALDGKSYLIVGVMPPTFAFPSGTDLWLPADLRLAPGNTRMRPVIGRLRDGVTARQAEAELKAMSAGFSTIFGEPKELEARVFPINYLLVRNVSRTLMVF